MAVMKYNKNNGALLMRLVEKGSRFFIELTEQGLFRKGIITEHMTRELAEKIDSELFV